MSRPLDQMTPGRYDDGVFAVGREHGFLPKRHPLARLPEPFEAVQKLIDELPVELPNGNPGLLGTPNGMVEPVEALEDLTEHIEALDPEDDDDARLLQALFRSYTFLASGYLLAPAHHGRTAERTYGKARSVLPAQLARPLVASADKLGVAPWLDYHHAYSLGNYTFIDPDLPDPEVFRWDNLTMAARFSGKPDESGFIMLHVHINAHARTMVGSIFDAIAAARAEDTEALRSALRENLAAMRAINEVRREMWKASRPQRYNDFRVFIMGITGNEALFGPGVVYEGVERYKGEPQQFRGQTGAQDDIIPAQDIFAGVIDYYPDNQLTRYLMDLRTYRPPIIQEFFVDLEQARTSSGLGDAIAADDEATALLAGIVEQIYLFRNGHWQFVQRYIMANTKYATATGGTPITSWLPNQIDACLTHTRTLAERVEDLSLLTPATAAVLAELTGLQDKRERILAEQLAELEKAQWDADRVFELNDGEYDDKTLSA